MTEVFHDGRLRASAARDFERALGRAGIIVFAGEQIERAAARVDVVELVGDIAVDHVELEVTLEHAGTALHVLPQRLTAPFVGGRVRDKDRYATGRAFV